MLADSWLIPFHSVWKDEEFVREFNLKQPAVQHLVKIDGYEATNPYWSQRHISCPSSAVSQLKAACTLVTKYSADIKGGTLTQRAEGSCHTLPYVLEEIHTGIF